MNSVLITKDCDVGDDSDDGILLQRFNTAVFMTEGLAVESYV
jgi:hypothetical protein